MDNNNFLKQLTDNLKCIGKHNNMGDEMVVTPAFKFSVKSQMILEDASNIV